jgi:tetratricopeptide (TPR) repeat protein
MARSRFNYKFVGITSGVLAAAVASAIVIKKMAHTRNPDQLIAEGDLFVSQGDFTDAVDRYGPALVQRPKDVALHIKMGKCLFQLAGTDPDNVTRALGEFSEAANYDPKNKDAWKGLLTIYIESLERLEAQGGRPDERHAHQLAELTQNVGKAREAAQRVLELDPNDLLASYAIPMINLRLWMLKMTIPLTAQEQARPLANQPKEAQQVEDAMVALTQLLKKHSADEQIPYWLAKSKIYQATNSGTSKGGQAAALFAEADAAFDDAIAANPTVPRLYICKADILENLIAKDPSADQQAEYRKQMKDAVGQAERLVDIKVSKQDYFNAKVKWARLLSGTDQGQSEAAYRDLIKLFPEVPGLSRELAHMLDRDRSRMDDALAVLDAVPSIPPPTFHGSQQFWQSQYADTKLDRASFEIDRLAYLGPGEKRQQMIDDIKKSLAAAAGEVDGTAEYLIAQGKFQMATSDVRDSIQTLKSALAKRSAQGIADADLLRSLARAYQLGQQPGNAIDLLKQSMQIDPALANNAEVRSMLASLYIQIGKLDLARPEVDWLVARVPENPGLLQMELAALGPKPDPQAETDLLKKVPETTGQEIAFKINICSQLKNVPERDRLIEKLYNVVPDDASVALLFMKVQVTQGRNDDAIKVVKDALAKHPDNADLKIALIDLTQNNLAASYNARLEAIKAIKDPLRREPLWAQLCAEFNRTDERIEHLQNAVAVLPDDVGLNQELFLTYIDVQRFADATAMLQHLSDINADQAHGQILRVKLALAQKDSATAVTIARQLVQDNADYWVSYEMLGEAYQQSGQFDLAAQQFVTVLDKQQTNVDALSRLISCEVALNKLAEARRYIAAARRMYPEDPAFIASQVNFEARFGNAEPLLPELAATVAKNPDVQRNYTLYAEALESAYRAREEKGQDAEAAELLKATLDTLKEANRRWPDDLKFAVNYAEALRTGNDAKGTDDASKKAARDAKQKAAEDVILAAAARPRWKDQPAAKEMVGNCYYGELKFKEAEPFFRDAVGLAPNNVSLRVALAETLWHEGTPGSKEDAVRVMKPAINGQSGAFRLYDQYLVSLGRGQQAETETTNALALNPKSQELNDLLIDVYVLNGKRDQAIELARKVVADDPKNVYADFQLGKLMTAGPKPDLAEAAKDITIFRDAHPDSVEARVTLAQVYNMRGDRDRAIAETQVAARLAPEDRRIRLQLLADYLNTSPTRTAEAQQLVSELLAMPQFQHDPDFQRTAAILYAQDGDSAKALTAIADAVQNAPKDGPGRDLVMKDYLRVLLLTKSYEKLLEESNKLLADPKTAAGWVPWSYRGRAKATAGDAAGAVGDFNTALDKAGVDTDPNARLEAAMQIKEQIGLAKAVDLIKPRTANSIDWKLVLVSLYIGDQDYNSALAYAEEAMKAKDQMSPDVQRSLIRIDASLCAGASPPRYDRAAELYREVLSGNPDDVESMNDLASVEDDSPDKANFSDALIWSTKAFDIKAAQGAFNAKIYDTQGWTLILNGKVDAGMDVLHQAAERAELPDLHYHLARGYLKKDRPEDAKRELELATRQLSNAIANKDPYDSTLPDKISQAGKEADKMLAARTQ